MPNTGLHYLSELSGLKIKREMACWSKKSNYSVLHEPDATSIGNYIFFYSYDCQICITGQIKVF